MVTWALGRGGLFLLGESGQAETSASPADRMLWAHVQQKIDWSPGKGIVHPAAGSCETASAGGGMQAC